MYIISFLHIICPAILVLIKYGFSYLAHSPDSYANSNNILSIPQRHWIFIVSVSRWNLR